MIEKKLTYHAGNGDRRKNNPAIYWVKEKLPRQGPVVERRIDADSRQVLIDLFNMVRSRRSVGLVFGVLNRDGTVDMGMSGGLFEDPLFARWVIHRLDLLTTDLPNYPDS